jgi:hypothetical protein
MCCGPKNPFRRKHSSTTNPDATARARTQDWDPIPSRMHVPVVASFSWRSARIESSSMTRACQAARMCEPDPVPIPFWCLSTMRSTPGANPDVARLAVWCGELFRIASRRPETKRYRRDHPAHDHSAFSVTTPDPSFLGPVGASFMLMPCVKDLAALDRLRRLRP